MERKYQADSPPCPSCGRPMSKYAKTCAFCAGKGSGNISKRNYIEKICEYCKSPFSIPKWRESQGRGRFCSRECKDAYQKLLVGDKSPKWKGGLQPRYWGKFWRVIRLWALERAGYKCQRCGIPNSGVRRLIVHHKVPYAKASDVIEACAPENLEVLCEKCHSKVELLGKNRGG